VNPVGSIGVRLAGSVPSPGRLDGVGVYLRPLQTDDLEPAKAWLADAGLVRTTTSLQILNAARNGGSVAAAVAAQPGISLAICLQENDVVIGVTGLYDIDWRNRSARFEFVVAGDSRVSGKGYRTDAARTMVEYGFRELNLHRQYILLYDNNVRGRRVYSIVGFAEEGRLKQAYIADGKHWDVQIWGVLAAAYYEKKRQDAATESQPE
jgi:RimJ/RimL family protein N-acetyltransferase